MKQPTNTNGPRATVIPSSLLVSDIMLEHLQEFAISTWHQYNFGETRKIASNSLAKQLGINSNLVNLPSARANIRARIRLGIRGSSFLSGALRSLSGALRSLSGALRLLNGPLRFVNGFFYFTKSKIPNSWRWIVFLLDI